MESPLLSAIHLTQVECEAACDTFMPPVDASKFKLWSAGAPRKEGDTRYSLLCYTRAGQEGLPALPPAVASRHEELQVWMSGVGYSMRWWGRQRCTLVGG
jgi:dihydrofolate reductase/thymidylate synthase